MTSFARPTESAPAPQPPDAWQEPDWRSEICRVGASLYARGYVHASAGNISVQLPEALGGGHLITPTDACLGQLQPEQLARVDAQGRQSGGAPASKTLALHRRIYAATAASAQPARCIIHTHSTHCVALTLGMELGPVTPRELLPPLTPYFVMKVGHVPVLPYHRPGDPAVAERVAETIATWAARGLPLRAVMLPRLGPNVWGDSPAQAMATLEELEETARLWWLCGQATPSLDAAALQELQSAFGARW